jgi:hypothetical protein
VGGEVVDEVVGAGHADVLADGDGHVPARPEELVGDLDAGDGGADDEDPPGPEVVGPAVPERVTWWIPAGRSAAAAGTWARLNAPLASTTAGASQVPAVVSTR